MPPSRGEEPGPAACLSPALPGLAPRLQGCQGDGCVRKTGAGGVPSGAPPPPQSASSSPAILRDVPLPWTPHASGSGTPAPRQRSGVTSLLPCRRIDPYPALLSHCRSSALPPPSRQRSSFSLLRLSPDCLGSTGAPGAGGRCQRTDCTWPLCGAVPAPLGAWQHMRVPLRLHQLCDLGRAT